MGNNRARKSSGLQKSQETLLHDVGFHYFSDQEKLSLRGDLLSWYDVNKRELPWRQHEVLHSDIANAKEDTIVINGQRAYEVWISEIMLQQTQVKTVIPFYTRWMERFPTISDLASSSLDDVNKAWAGLGYYSRARRIHEAACKIVQFHNGVLPTTAAKLVTEVPGIGPYTAGAIASIAYGEAAELVDGNVVRVLSRLRVIGADPKSNLAVKLHWKLAKDLLDTARPGDFNQALMELGATVCTPRQPSCPQCPVKSYCQAWAQQNGAVPKRNSHTIEEGLSTSIIDDIENPRSGCQICGEHSAEDDAGLNVTRFPTKTVKKVSRRQDTAVCIVERHVPNSSSQGYPIASSELLLVQRPTDGLLGGLWEFPSVVLSRDEINDKVDTSYQTRVRLMRQYLETTLNGRLFMARKCTGRDLSIKGRRDLGSVPHLFTHIKQEYWVEHIVVNRNADAAQVSLGETHGARSDSAERDDKPTYRWVALGDFAGEAVSTAMKKVFQLLTAAPRKRDREALEAEQSPQKQKIRTFKYSYTMDQYLRREE